MPKKSWRTSDPTTAHAVLRKWKKAVQDVNDKKGIRKYWEGNVAYKELKKTGFLEAVPLAKQFWKPGRKMPIDWRLRAAIEDVDSEIRGYLDTQGKIVEITLVQIKFSVAQFGQHLMGPVRP